MNYYETLYIVHSALEAGRLKDIVLSVEDLLKANGGTPIATEVWGKKKLGYIIDKQKYGTYILVQFKSDGSKNNSFNVELEHNPSILAHMIIRIEENSLREQTDDLDAQIAGKEAKSGTNLNNKESEGNLIDESDKSQVDEEIKILSHKELPNDENGFENSDNVKQEEKESKTKTPEASKHQTVDIANESGDEKATEKVGE